MSVHHVLLRARLTAALALVLALAAPAATLAAPSPDSCASYVSTQYLAAVPGAMRTPGVHGFEFHASIVLDGVPTDLGTLANEVEIDQAAPAYPNTVYLSLFDNRTLLKPNDDDETQVTAMQPGQAALIRVGAFAFRDDAAFKTLRIRFRYEGAPGDWSTWSVLEPGPYTSTCGVLTYGYIHRAFDAS